jgi:hypothetical protein
MNWVGGSLHRHSKRQLVTGKRSHQGKGAKSGRIEGNNAGSFTFRPNFLHADCDITNGPSNRQARLDEYPDIAPVVHLLQEMHESNQSALSSRSRDPRRKQRSNIEPDTVHFQTKAGTVNNPITVAESEDEEKDSLEYNQDGTPWESDPNGLSRKRLQLLNQMDWAGLKHSRPLRINFTKHKNKVLQRRLHPAESASTRPEENFYERGQHTLSRPTRDGDSENYMSRNLPPIAPSIQVKIGTDALQSTHLSTGYDMPNQWDRVMLPHEAEHNLPVQSNGPSQDMASEERAYNWETQPKLRSGSWLEENTLIDRQRDVQEQKDADSSGINKTISPSHPFALTSGRISQRDTRLRSSANKTKTSASSIKEVSVLVGAHRIDADNMESRNLHYIPRFQNDVPEPTKHMENIHAVATSASRNVLSPISSSPASDPCSGPNCREADNCLLQQANGGVRGSANTLRASPQNQVDMPTKTFAAEKVATKAPSTPSDLKEIEQLATQPSTDLEDEEDLTWRKFVFGSPEKREKKLSKAVVIPGHTRVC